MNESVVQTELESSSKQFDSALPITPTQYGLLESLTEKYKGLSAELISSVPDSEALSKAKKQLKESHANAMDAIHNNWVEPEPAPKVTELKTPVQNDADDNADNDADTDAKQVKFDEVKPKDTVTVHKDMPPTQSG